MSALRAKLFGTLGAAMLAALTVSQPQPTPQRPFNPKERDAIDNQSEPDGSAEALDTGLTPTSAAEEQAARRGPDSVQVLQQVQATWNTYGENKDGSNSGNNVNQPFVWDLQGPTHATQPGILSFSGAQYHMAGRVTALAITPDCTTSRCRLWVAAAGGGVWRTDNPFSPDPYYTFVSNGFRSNAIGTLDQDPSDPTGNTLYAGTGEANASGDSEAGVGIYKTTNGGDTWTFLPGSALFATRSISRIAVDPVDSNILYVGIARGVRGISSVSGGTFTRTGNCTSGPGGLSCRDGPDQAPLGLFRSIDGGATFTQIWNVSNASVRGVNNVAIDPSDRHTVYAAAFNLGLWRCSSVDGCDPTTGTPTFHQVFRGTSPLTNTNRTEFTLTTVTPGSSTAAPGTRIYVLDGSVGIAFARIQGRNVQISFPSQVWRADGASTLTAAALLATEPADPNAVGGYPNVGAGWAKKSSRTSRPASDPYRPAYNPCTGQCWYDAMVYTPAGFPDTVYVLGSYQYGELRERSNGRGVLLSTTAGDPDPAIKGGNFSDLTWDDTPHAQPDQTHPDQHALVTPRGQPFLYFEGSDGGLIRNDGQFDDASADCVKYHFNDPDTLVHCQRVLSRVPHQIFDTLNKGLSTTQFQSVSLNPNRPLHDLQGGTQDNGTFDWDSQLTTWYEEMYGDGGQSGYNYGDDRIRFNTFTGSSTDENFRSGQVDRWVVTSGPLQNTDESAPFYMAIVSDYTNFGFQYAGLNHVWRTTDNGGPQAYLEANCPEFTTFSNDPRCGDWRPLGDPTYVPVSTLPPTALPEHELGKPGDLTSTLYGVDRTLGNVVAVERNPGNDNELWAATTTGRVFVSLNVNSPDAGAVQFCRLDQLAANSPPRFISSIAPDPANPARAFLSYDGYNSNTKDQPGHVFEVTFTPGASGGCPTAAVWRDLLVEVGGSDHSTPPGDLPIDDLARDDLTGDLYAATDFGVLRGHSSDAGATYVWTQAGTNLPFVEVAGLTIDPCSRVLYAATHGRAIWRMFLPAAPGAPSASCPRTP